MHCRPSQRNLMMFRKRASVSSSSSPSPAASGASPQRPPSSNGTTAGCHISSPSPALIQRFIILHDGLMPLPPSKTQPRSRSKQRRSPQLSEDASLAEHGEFILYYYDHSLHFEQGRQTLQSPFVRRISHDSDTSMNSTRGETPPADHATEEAVRFAGLCRALRSLPLALQPEKHDVENHDDDCARDEKLSETDVVHLQDSTLVFVPLELGGTIIAIAQIPRADKPQKTTFSKSSYPESQPTSAGYGADPSAMQRAMKHAHATFSLLFGGEIHRRLLWTKKVESSNSWVLEVVEDDDDEDDEDSDLSENDICLRQKGDSTCEVANNKQVESVEKELTPNKGSRRKARSLRQLSRSITGSANSVDMKKYQSEDSPFGEYCYGGMKELFSLRREHRKLSNELKDDRPIVRFGGLRSAPSKRWGSNSNAADLFNDIANDYGHDDCERRIWNLLEVLPITPLREDLVKFYDEWLGRMQGVCEIMQGGVGRCVVDMVPAPLINNSTRNPVRGQHPPLSPTAFVCLAGGEFMKLLMNVKVPKLKGLQSRLIGMSMFYQNRLVLSEVSSSYGKKHGHVDLRLPPEIPYMIAEYFHCSEKRQMITKTAASVSVQHSQDADVKPLVRWMSGLSFEAADNAKPSTSSEVNNKNAATGHASPGFMAYPPALSDSSGRAESFFVRNLNKHIWLPRVFLPFASSFDIGDDDETETYAALFESKELSFILIFEIASFDGEESALAYMTEELKPKSRKVDKGSSKPSSNDTEAFTDMITFVADQLTEFCKTYSVPEVDSVSGDVVPAKEMNSNSVFPGEHGMDIIYVDRDQSSFILLSHHDLSSNDFKRIAPKNDGLASVNGSKPKFGLFGIGPKPKETSEEEVPGRALQYSNMLDCRHKLAAYLPLDVMLAFDDMFNGMECLSCRRNGLTFSMDGTDGTVSNDTCTNKSIEMCTFLPQGWVYGRAFGNVELYVLLDTSKFVTINDVQKAVSRVRERIFNDKIR